MSTLTVKLCRFKLTNEVFTKHANKKMQKKMKEEMLKMKRVSTYSKQLCKEKQFDFILFKVQIGYRFFSFEI